MPSLIKTLHTARKLYKRDRNFPRGKLAVDFLRQVYGPGQEMQRTVMGKPWRITSARDFAIQYREIFVDQGYYFESSNNAPRILDVGSNVGLSILYFKLLYPNSVITGFEPDPDIFAALNANITDNHLSNVTLHRAALGNSDGELTLYRNPDHKGHINYSTPDGKQNLTPYSVPCKKLSGFLSSPCDLIKMDIEGGEWGVIEDLINTNTLQRAKNYAIEYHHRIDGKNRLGEFIGAFESRGFAVTLLAIPHRDDVWGQQNILLYAKQSA